LRSFWSLDPQQKLADARAAATAYQAAIRGNPQEMENVYGLAMATLSMGREEEGLRLLREAADKNPCNLE